MLLAGCTQQAQDAVKNAASSASSAASSAAGAAGAAGNVKMAAAVLGAQSTLTAAEDQAKANGVTIDQAQVDALKTKLTDLKSSTAQTAPTAIAAVDTAFQGVIDNLNAVAASSTGVKQIAAQKIGEALTTAKNDLDAQVK
jgi:hypothetical protein